MDPTPTSPEALGRGGLMQVLYPSPVAGAGVSRGSCNALAGGRGSARANAVAGEGLYPRIALQFGRRAPASTVRRYAASLGAEAGVIAPNPR